MTILDFRKEKAKDIVLTINPDFKICGYQVTVAYVSDKHFQVNVGCVSVIIDRSSINDWAFSNEPCKVLKIVKKGCKTSSSIFREEAGNFYISTKNLACSKDQYDLIEVDEESHGKRFGVITKGRDAGKVFVSIYGERRVINGDSLKKILYVIDIIRNFYKEFPEKS